MVGYLEKKVCLRAKKQGINPWNCHKPMFGSLEKNKKDGCFRAKKQKDT